MRSRALFVGFLLVGLAACGPKPKPVPKAPPPPPPAQLGEACKADGGGQGNCASGLTCDTVGGGSFCASACPCGAGAVCAVSPDVPEMCMKACTSDGDCKSGLKCNSDWGACAPEGLLAAKAPACTAPALTRKAFGKVNPISKAGGKATHTPAVAFDRNGDLVSVYVAGTGPGSSTLASAKATFNKDEVVIAEADKAVALERENAGHPWIARDRNGKLYMAFLAWNGPMKKNMMVGLSTSDDGVTWSKPVAAFDANLDCPGDAAGCLDRPIVAVGPDRDEKKKNEVIYVLYWSNATNTLRSVHSTDGGQTFSTSVQVGTGGYADADVTSSGKLHVVFTSGAGNKMGDTGNGVYYTSSSDGGESFIPPVRISSQNEPVPYHFASPRVVVDVPRRMLYAVYTAGTSDGKWEIVLSSSKDGGVTWTRESVNDDQPCATHMLPAAALDPSTGKVHIVWLENRAGGGAAAYATCDKAGTSCAKNEAVSDAPFATFGYGRGSAATLGDSIAVIVDSKHKLLHALWAQPVDEGGAATARVFHSAAKLR